MYYKPFLGATNTGRSLDIYTILRDGYEWWACQEDGHQLIFQGKSYRKICEVNFIGREGTKVIGMLNILKTRNLMPYKYDFTFVSDDLMAGLRLKNIRPVKMYADLKS